MSLIHWWPLNGNTNDYGINSLALINKGATINSTGKIGKCYSFNNNNMVVATSDITSAAELSLCLWLKLSTSHSGYAQVLVLGTSGTSWNNIRCGIDTNGDGRIYFNVSSGSANTYIYSPLNYKDNIWHHITGIYNSGSLQLYIDGIQVATGTTTNVPGLSGTSIYVGGNAGGEKANNGDCLNDIRIYNHALSAKEVKEISKGLMLHYNFEDIGRPNLLLGNWSCQSTNSTHTTSGTVNIKLPTGMTLNDLIGKTLAFSYDYSVEGDRLNNTGNYSKDRYGIHGNMSVKTTSSASASTQYPFAGYLEARGTGKAVQYFSIPSSWYSIESLSLALQPYNRPAAGNNATWYIKNLKLEILLSSTDKATDFIDSDLSKIYDNSGYGYNGAVAGNIQLSSDSAAGKHSIYSPAGANYVERQNFPVAGFNADQQFTINAWIKIVGYNGTNWNTIFRLAATNARDQQLHFCYNSSGNILLSQYSDDPQFTTNVPLNTWAMVTWVHYTEDSTAKCQYFVNGQQVGSTQSYSGLLNIKDNARLTLFYDSIRRSYDSNLYMGDFKIYSTALSAEDILAEYNRKAAIDKNGNLFTGEIVETNTNANIADKNNQIKATYFVEGKDTVKIFGGYTELDYFDQINPAAGATSQHNRCTISDISYDHIEARVNVTGQGTSGGIIFSNGMWWKTYTGRGNVNDGSGTVTMTPASFSQNVWTDVSWDFSKVFSVLYTSGWSDGINYWTPQNVKVAYIKTYIGSELTGHFIPVKNKNNVIGLFNLVTNKFYSNTGTGTEGFVAGNSLGKLSLIQENKIEEL